jgi:hypothetical protein
MMYGALVLKRLHFLGLNLIAEEKTLLLEYTTLPLYVKQDQQLV